MRYTRRFKEISKDNANEFGGKVASLGEMLKAGIPVPDGFGISTDAFVSFNGKDFTDEFKQELHEMFKGLNVVRVAVRSSAIAEDSSVASWAGQLESYLNVDEDGFELAIRKCWNSINSNSAKSYAADKKLSKEDLFVGVAVQKMVNSDVAGVMFTANPVSNNIDELIIESAYGLGEVVVQGITTPDRFTLDKKGMWVVEFSISIKEKMMIFESGKNKIIDVPEQIADRTSLREDEVLKLANLGIKIEKHYKKPMDIEWAFEGKKFYIVQSRPITTFI